MTRSTKMALKVVAWVYATMALGVAIPCAAFAATYLWLGELPAAVLTFALCLLISWWGAVRVSKAFEEE